MKEAFTAWRPREDTIVRVVQCAKIIEEYQAQGLVLTLRQLFYQLVSRDLISNTERSYKTLGTIVGKARMAGYLDWDAIEDRGRRPDTPNQFTGLDHLVEVALRAYRLDRWKGQETYTELWVEKSALAGVLEPMASRYHVTLMVNKGYSSLSAMYESAQRIVRNAEDKDGAVIFYLGDHDPSGNDMVRDIRDRLNTFAFDKMACDIEVKKIALTMDQIEEYNPPPNPTKLTDSRALDYIRKYGRECWEVDALDPATLQAIIADALESVVDMDLMEEIKEQEERDKKRLRRTVKELS